MKIHLIVITQEVEAIYDSPNVSCSSAF